MSNVTTKSTKQEILDALHEAEAKLAERNAAVISPVTEASEKKKVETVSRAEAVIGLDILNPKVVEDYNTVKEAIEIKKAELQELYGIEKNAETLFALVNVQNDKKERFDAEMDDKQLNAYNRLDDINNQISEAKRIFDAEMSERRTTLEKERKREADEFEYNKKRERKLADDKWADEKAAREKVLEDKENAVNMKLEAVAVREEKMDELEAKVAEIPALIQAAKDEAFKAGQADAARANAFEVRAIKSATESEKAILNSKIEHITESNERLAEENDKLQEKLDAAYTKIQETANKSLESAANTKMFETMRGMNSDTRNQK
jgi:hypothetical protein